MVSDPVPDAPGPASRPPRGAVRFVRPVVALGLLGGLLIYSSPSSVLSSLASASPAWLAAAGALVLIDRTVNAYRWLWLLRSTPHGRRVPTTAVLRVFFISTFFGSFLPSGVGGDAVRTIALTRRQVPAAEAFASVAVDRLLGVVSVLLMALLGLVMVRGVIEARSMTLLVTAGVALLSASVLVIFEQRWLVWGLRLLSVGPLAGISRRLERGLQAVGEYRHQRRALLLVLAASVGVQVLRTLQAWCLGVALGVEADLLWYFAFVPVIILVMQLPISVAGLGTGTAAFQLLFGTIGIAPAETFAMSILFSALGLLGNIPGALLLALDRRRPGADRA